MEPQKAIQVKSHQKPWSGHGDHLKFGQPHGGSSLRIDLSDDRNRWLEWVVTIVLASYEHIMIIYIYNYMGISMYIYIWVKWLTCGSWNRCIFVYMEQLYIYNTYINIGLTEMLGEQNYIHQFTVSLCSAWIDGYQGGISHFYLKDGLLNNP